MNGQHQNHAVKSGGCSQQSQNLSQMVYLVGDGRREWHVFRVEPHGVYAGILGTEDISLEVVAYHESFLRSGTCDG